jgi:hypothetical protein
VGQIAGKMEEPACAPDILRNLMAQGVHVRELSFLTKPLHERKLYFRFGCDLDLMEVEQVGFNGE